MQPADLAEEDRARAECYALVSTLFYAPPAADLLQRLGELPEPAAEGDLPAEPAPYAQAFAALRRACRAADAEAVRQEYDDLFVGAGKAAVTPYTSAYALPHAPDRHLLALREQLAALGLVRAASVFEMEDHAAAVCDVMRWLIEHGAVLDEQRAFFDEFIWSGLDPFCSAIETSPMASFYRAVAALTRAFIAIEREAFTLYEG